MKKERVLSICAVLALLALSLLPATPIVLAYSITVDGDPSDWTMAAPPYVNLGHIGRDASQQGGYIWSDLGGDERTDFASLDTRVDLTEFQVTGDASNIYFLACMTDIDQATNDGAPQVQIAIDNDQDGSGTQWFGGNANDQVDPNAYWEYLLFTRFGSSNGDVRVWTEGFASASDVGSAAIDGTNECIELSVPWASLGGGPPVSPWRFTVATFRANASDDVWDIGGSSVSDILDCITNYGDPGDVSSSTWAEVSDQVVNYYFDLYFETDGDVYPPLLISEVLYDPSGSEPGSEFIEVYNASPSSINLDWYKVGDEETIGGGEGMEEFPTASSIASGGVVVLANNADTFNTTYGFLPDYAINDGGQPVLTTSNYSTWAGGNVYLTNSGDEVILLDGSDTAIDVVEYADSTPEWTGMSNTNYNVSAGQSMQRTPANVDTNDISADFVAQSNDGTPGSVPTAVELVSFTARPRRNGIRLEWATATELDNLGFHLYRAESLEGERLRLNDSLIPAQAPGSPIGGEYTWLDTAAQPGISYYYWLEDVDLHGQATSHGPVSATMKPRLQPAPAPRIEPGLAPEHP